MKKVLFLLLFIPVLLFGQRTADFSSVTIDLTSLPDSTDFQYTVAGDTIKASKRLILNAFVRLLAEKVGIGTDTPGAASEVLIRNAGNDSTEWRLLADGDIPNTITITKLNYILDIYSAINRISLCSVFNEVSNG